VSDECCHLEVYATGRSPVQRSPAECGVTECDIATLIMKRPCGLLGLSSHGNERKTFKKCVFKNIVFEASFSHYLKQISLKRNLELFNMRFGSNYVLYTYVVEEVYFTHHCDWEALCVPGSNEMGTKENLLHIVLL
jgi:hypothetical protein